MTISPATASGNVGDGAQFRATSYDASGNALSGRTTVWSSSNPSVVTVSSSGYATAVGPGTASLLATAEGITGTSEITVLGTAPPPSPQTAPSGTTPTVVAVSPTTATLELGATQQLSAVVRDLLGQVLPAAVSWTSSNPGIATVNASGVVTGVRTGQATITVSVFGLAAAVTINVSPPGPPADPATYPLLATQPFDLLDVLSWKSGYNSGLSIIPDLTAPQSPATVLQIRYDSGFTAGHAPGLIYHPLNGARHIYSAVWWKVSDPWQGEPSNVNKLQFLMNANGGGDIAMVMHGPPGGPYRLRIFNQLANGDSRDQLLPNRSNTAVTLGAWHKVEWQVDYSSAPGIANGVVRWWMDGELLGEYTDFVTPANVPVEYQLAPTWGGIGGVKTRTDYYWIDHILLRAR